MAKPIPTPEVEGGNPLDEVEVSAWADIKAAINGGDDDAGIAALRDFVKACIKRGAAEEYSEPAEE